MDTLETLKRLLEHNRLDRILKLLRRARLEIQRLDSSPFNDGADPAKVLIFTPIEDCEQLRDLKDFQKERLTELLKEIHPESAGDLCITEIEFLLDANAPTLGQLTDAELAGELEVQREIMIDVATGGARIQAVNSAYRKRRRRISDALRARGIPDPNPYDDLWDWYNKWSSGDMPSYASRRVYISGLFSSLIDRLSSDEEARGAEVFEEPSGWTKVDNGLAEVRSRLQDAATPEQHQAVGLLCRETIISLAQAVFDPEVHPPIDDVDPSPTDAKRMLEAYFEKELAGGPNKEARKHARASLDLANKLQHDRTADFRKAALCAEATASVVNIVAIVSGQRDP